MTPLLMVASMEIAGSDHPPVDGGDLTGSAYTLSERLTQIALDTRVRHGIREGLQAGTRVLSWDDGPNARVEWSFGDTGTSAWSFVSQVQIERDGGYDFGNGVVHTWGARDRTRLSLGLSWWESRVFYESYDNGYPYTDSARFGYLMLPVQTDLVAGRHTVQLRGMVAPGFRDIGGSVKFSDAAYDDTVWRASASWVVGWRVYRLSLGVAASNLVTDDYADLFAQLGLVPTVEVAPKVRMWWTF